MLRHLLAQIPGAGVDDQIAGAISRLVNLDEVVSPAQSAKAPPQTCGVLQIPEAAQPGQVEGLLPSLPHVLSGGDEVGRLVHLLHVNFNLAQIHRVHAAANVYPHNVRHHLVGDSHGGANGAATSCVYIRHNTDFAAGGKLVVAHPANLLHCLVLDYLGKAESGVNFSLNFQHGFHPFLYFIGYDKSRLPHTRQAAYSLSSSPRFGLPDPTAIFLYLAGAHDKTVQFTRAGLLFRMLFVRQREANGDHGFFLSGRCPWFVMATIAWGGRFVKKPVV